MDITRKDLSATHATISVAISKEDYAEKIEKILKDYKKQAVLPGFRKGMVPMSHRTRRRHPALIIQNEIIFLVMRRVL